MVVDPLKKPVIEVFKDTQPTEGGALHRATIGRLQLDWLSIMHSFPVTKNYIIMPQFPLGIKAAKALAGSVGSGARMLSNKIPVNKIPLPRASSSTAEHLVVPTEATSGPNFAAKRV